MRTDDLLAALALVASAGLCVAFRYLPMVDLPQHYAMVSILLHHADPAWGFAQRYTFDFLGRPYATVYWLGAVLGWVMPLGAAMRIVVAACTIAPLTGAFALLVAMRRSRVWILPAIPLAFGSLWHWGFLNFLLGTGLFLGGLALVVRVAERPRRAASLGLAVLGVFLLFTHFHGLVMLLVTAPLVAWGWRSQGDGLSPYVRTLGPLAPAALAGAAFVALTWSQAVGTWSPMNPGVAERVVRFPEFLAGGAPAPWAEGTVAAFAVVAAAGVALGGAPVPKRKLVALGIALCAQVGLYFALPLNTSTATYVSARHALLIALLILPLLPSPEGRLAWVPRALGTAVALGALIVMGRDLAGFDREAREFDGVLAAMQPARRVAPLIWARGSDYTDARAFPYLHFAGYYQAAKGGELARSFAVVWNVPIRYRADYARYPIREDFEWNPSLFSAEDARHFDYVLVRGAREPSPALGLREVSRSGAFALYEVARALPAGLPPP